MQQAPCLLGSFKHYGGEVAEWLKAVDSKSTVPLLYRGFESLTLRHLLGFPLFPFPSYDHSMTKSWVSPHMGEPMASIDTYTTNKGQTVYRVRIRRQGKAQTRIFLTKREATHWAQQQEGLLLAGLAGIPQKRQPHTLAEAL